MFITKELGAIAEFEYTLTFADAPIDRFARGERNALTEAEKRGALLFFGAARCSSCHSVSGASNEMFSDFQVHVIGVPQIAPSLTNNVFDGPGANEDFGREQITGDRQDRYKFRTSPHPAIAAATESLDRTARLQARMRLLEKRLAALPVILPESGSHNRPLLSCRSRESRLARATAVS